jgi:hypothetical protein
VAITVSPSDNNGQSNGNTQFMLNYNNGAVVTLSTPPTAGGNNFSSWTGCDSTPASTCTVTMNERQSNGDRQLCRAFIQPHGEFNKPVKRSHRYREPFRPERNGGRPQLHPKQ